MRIGLTGGIGSGKSTVAAMLVARGAKLVDTDAIARSIAEPGGAAVRALVTEFGPSILTPEGGMDRARMRELVFSDVQAKINELGKLEAHIHYEFRGDTELYLRMLFRRISRNKWPDFLKQMSIYGGVTGEVSDVSASDPAKTHEPFQLDYKMHWLLIYTS